MQISDRFDFPEDCQGVALALLQDVLRVSRQNHVFRAGTLLVRRYLVGPVLPVRLKAGRPDPSHATATEGSNRPMPPSSLLRTKGSARHEHPAHNVLYSFLQLSPHDHDDLLELLRCECHRLRAQRAGHWSTTHKASALPCEARFALRGSKQALRTMRAWAELAVTSMVRTTCCRCDHAPAHTHTTRITDARQGRRTTTAKQARVQREPSEGFSPTETFPETKGGMSRGAEKHREGRGRGQREAPPKSARREAVKRGAAAQPAFRPPSFICICVLSSERY